MNRTIFFYAFTDIAQTTHSLPSIARLSQEHGSDEQFLRQSTLHTVRFCYSVFAAAEHRLRKKGDVWNHRAFGSALELEHAKTRLQISMPIVRLNKTLLQNPISFDDWVLSLQNWHSGGLNFINTTICVLNSHCNC